MSLFKKTVLFSAALGVAASMAFAGGHEPTPMERAVKARQAKMTLYSFNLGLLGGMAKGDIDYSADAAGLAANNLAALTAVFMPGAWPEGSDSSAMKGTRTLPALWTDDPAKVAAKGKALRESAQTLAKVAGTDLAALQGAIGPVGQACGACHKAYRADK